MSFTVVSFHAHPDDEVLLTGGTLARAAGEGHRVVIVVATDGAQGLTTPGRAADLGASRLAELRTAAAIMGCHDVVCLGYPDSGMAGQHEGFSAMDPEQVAAVLARILTAEGADVLTTYDAQGGYGHPDHRQVHHVGQLAAELAGTPVVMQATVDRDRLVPVLRWLQRLRLLPGSLPAEGFTQAFSAGKDITHGIDVRAQARVKRAGMRAHASQTVGGTDLRTLRLLSRLPLPLFRLACGTEWFIQTGKSVPIRPRDPSGSFFDGMSESARDDRA